MNRRGAVPGEMMCKKRPLTREEYSAVLKSESRGVLSAQSGAAPMIGVLFRAIDLRCRRNGARLIV